MVYKNNNSIDFEKLPILKKEFFQKDLRNIISNDYRLNQVYQSQTSGSSGHPFYFAKDKFSHAITHALIIKNYQNYGLSVDDKQARFMEYQFLDCPDTKKFLKDKILNRVRFPVFDLSNIMFKNFYLNSTIKNLSMFMVTQVPLLYLQNI